MSIQAYQLSGAGQASIPNAPILSPRSPTTTDIVSPAGNPYQLLQAWKNTVTGSVFEYAGGGVWVEVVDSGGGGPITTLTGDSGGAIAPVAGNINILGTGTTTVVGSGNTLTVTPTASGYPITPFVVGAVGKAGYQTIASAITAAASAGGGLVFIQPGTYTENLTLVSNVFLVGASFQDVTIVGVHTPPASGTLNFKDITFQSATHIFSSAVAGSTAITVTYSNFTITTGYIFNLANWTGALQLVLCGEVGSTTDGIVTNAGGSSVTLLNSTVGAGTANSMSTTGVVIINDASIQCPWTAATGTAFTVDDSEFSRTITLANNSTGLFDGCRFSTGATSAITHSSSGTVSLSESTIVSSNASAIAGAGAGVLTMSGVSFTSTSVIAGTLTTAAGVIRGGNFVTQYVVGASPDAKYQTIQSAITAAAAAGGGLVFIKPGSYTENLTLSSGVFIQGASFQDVTITGVHTPPASGIINFENVTLASATDIFNSAAAGSTAITVTYSNITVTTGYTFNLVNWTGPLQLVICGETSSTTNGIVTNAGGAAVTLLSSTLGAGTANAMSTTGVVIINDVNMQCPWTAATGTTISCDDSEFSRTITLANNSTGLFDACRFSTGATAALTQSSSGAIALLNCSIISSNNPAIAGAGAGVLTLGGVVFTSNTATAGTLTLGTADVFKSAGFQWLSVATASGATPQIANSRAGSVTFTGISIAAAADLTLVITNSSVTGSGTVVHYSMRGFTTGSACSIKSVTNSAGSSSIVVTNGTGATTTTADITFDFIVLN